MDADDANSAFLNGLNSHTTIQTIILYLYHGVIPPFITFAVVFVLRRFWHEKIGSHLVPGHNSLNDEGNVFTVTTAAVLIVLAVCGMDICGIVWSKGIYKSDIPPQYFRQHNNSSSSNEALFYLPIAVVTFVDFGCLIILFIWIVKEQCKIKGIKENIENWSKVEMVDDEENELVIVNVVGTGEHIPLEHLCSDNKFETDDNEENGHNAVDTEDRTAPGPRDDDFVVVNSDPHDGSISFLTRARATLIIASMGAIVFVISTHSFFVLIAFVNDPVHA